MRVQHLSVILRDTMCDLANKMLATSGYNGMELDTMGCIMKFVKIYVSVFVSPSGSHCLFHVSSFSPRATMPFPVFRNNPWHKPPYLGPPNEEIQYTIFSGVHGIMNGYSG